MAIAGCFVASHGDAAPLLESVEAAFDDVAVAAYFSVERSGPSARETTACTVQELVGVVGDRRLEYPGRQARRGSPWTGSLFPEDSQWTGPRVAPSGLGDTDSLDCGGHHGRSLSPR